MIKLFKALALVSILTPLIGVNAADKGGFSLGSTRIIYDAAQKEASLSVINTAENTPFLAQSWISNINEDAINSASQTAGKPPFVMTPPLYRQDKGKNTLRIIKTVDTLPNDRESAYWVNVKAIPAQKKKAEDANEISFAYVLKIKLFYRPVGLKGNAADAYKALSFMRSEKAITIKNPTPYYVTLNKVVVGGKEIKDVSAMVPPYQQQEYLLPQGVNSSQVEYRSLNDQGGVTSAITKTISQ